MMMDTRARLDALKKTLDGFRPLNEDQMRALWPKFKNDSVQRGKHDGGR